MQADLAIAPSDPKRIYATVATPRSSGIWRSDDGGEHWARITTDARPAARIGGGDLPVLAVHPKNPDVVFSASVVMWKSTDGGKTWMGLRGAPGGDDYQRLWINPDNPDIIATASDQGAVVTVNGGQTWSSWYNQPTAQLYHVAADNAFPYRVCSGQQESGSACVASRGNYGQVTVRHWIPVGVDEYGYAAPDPPNADIVYGGRGPTRFDRRTGQVQKVAGWRDDERRDSFKEMGEMGEMDEDLLDIAFLDPKRFKDAIRSNPEACSLVEGIIKSQMEKGYNGPHKQITKKK